MIFRHVDSPVGLCCSPLMTRLRTSSSSATPPAQDPRRLAAGRQRRLQARSAAGRDFDGSAGLRTATGPHGTLFQLQVWKNSRAFRWRDDSYAQLASASQSLGTRAVARPWPNPLPIVCPATASSARRTMTASVAAADQDSSAAGRRVPADRPAFLGSSCRSPRVARGDGIAVTVAAIFDHAHAPTTTSRTKGRLPLKIHRSTTSCLGGCRPGSARPSARWRLPCRRSGAVRGTGAHAAQQGFATLFTPRRPRCLRRCVVSRCPTPASAVPPPATPMRANPTDAPAAAGLYAIGFEGWARSVNSHAQVRLGGRADRQVRAARAMPCTSPASRWVAWTRVQRASRSALSAASDRPRAAHGDAFLDLGMLPHVDGMRASVGTAATRCASLPAAPRAGCAGRSRCELSRFRARAGFRTGHSQLSTSGQTAAAVRSARARRSRHAVQHRTGDADAGRACGSHQAMDITRATGTACRRRCVSRLWNSQTLV